MNFVEQFQQINALLTKTRQYWQILPFSHLSLPWENNQPLLDFLSTLSAEQVATLDGDDLLLRDTLAPYLGIDCDFFSSLDLRAAAVTEVPSRLKSGIKGRKWQQIERFSAIVPQSSAELLEWCAGKGHLGRLIGYQQQRAVTSIEWQQSLCHAGQQLSDKFKIKQVFVQGDVLSSTSHLLIKPQQHIVALHACGDLHVALLKQAATIKPQALFIAPCCYHLINNESYQPLSRAAKASQLNLNKADLSLSIQKTVVAGQRERNHSATEVAWRLGFDLLQRQLTNTDKYLAVPSIRQSMLSGSFKDFCIWACSKKSLLLTADIDFDYFEQAGWQRRTIIKRIELVTHAFRQLLERWLILDRVLYLQEHGYQVELLNFCETAITPRNAMIIACLK